MEEIEGNFGCGVEKSRNQRIERFTSTCLGAAAESYRKESTGNERVEAPGFVREQYFWLLLFTFSSLERQPVAADSMRSGAVRRSSGMARCSRLLQKSPTRWYAQTSASTTAGRTTCFRLLREGTTSCLPVSGLPQDRSLRIGGEQIRYIGEAVRCRGAEDSRSMTPFSFLRAWIYRRATSSPTCRFPCIVNAMTLLLSQMLTQACQHHGHLLSVYDDFFVMQRGYFDGTMLHYTGNTSLVCFFQAAQEATWPNFSKYHRQQH